MVGKKLQSLLGFVYKSTVVLSMSLSLTCHYKHFHIMTVSHLKFMWIQLKLGGVTLKDIWIIMEKTRDLRTISVDGTCSKWRRCLHGSPLQPTWWCLLELLYDGCLYCHLQGVIRIFPQCNFLLSIWNLNCFILTFVIPNILMHANCSIYCMLSMNYLSVYARNRSLVIYSEYVNSGICKCNN